LTASTAENDYAHVKQIVTLTFVCAVFGAMFAPTTVQPQQSDEKPAVVKIEGQTIRIRQCVKPLDENRQQEVAELMYGQKITNLSSRPIIIYRYAPAAYDVRLSDTLEGVQERKFQQKERPAPPSPPRHFDADSPDKSFRVLQPYQSFNYEYPQGLTFLPAELIDTEKRMLVGEFFIQLKVRTWGSTTEEAQTLQQRWAQYGDFFYHDVITEPFPVTFEKVGPTTARCNIPNQ
jgi:hypothetical protein